MERRQINVDLNNILDVAYLGVRRVSVFMGLGVNAALDGEFKEYQLTHITKLQLVPDVVGSEAIGRFKEEFKTWVEGNGLRELIETFSVFLERIYGAALLIHVSKDKVDMAALAAMRDSFNHKGFPDKLNILRSKFSVGPKHADYIVSINKARNCLTHRRGIVGKEDVDTSGKLRVAWPGMDVFVKTPSGERRSLMEIPPGGEVLPEGGTPCVQFVKRERLFDQGAHLRLSTRDLAEICWFFQREADATIRSVVKHAKANGVPLHVKGRSNEAVQPTPETGAADPSQ